MSEYKYKRFSYNSKERKNAVALSYDQEKNTSPVIVASGAGYVADRIIEVADKAGIPVYRDETATGLLSQLELGQEIPPELYQVAAEIFAHILKTSDELESKSEGAGEKG